MPRKRKGDEAPQAPPGQVAAESEGGNGEQPAGGGRRNDKVQAVAEALAKGFSSPKEIADHLRREHGLEITAAYVSVIKGKLRKQGGLSRPKGHKARPPGSAGPAARPPAAGLTPQDLAALVQIAERAGGIDSLQDFLSVLKRIK
jgi:hypothetical protein